MAYATQQDMIDRFGTPRMAQLSDVNEPITGAIVPAVLNAKLADASAEIDGYLVGRYALPLAFAPGVLKTYCCDIAYHRLLGPNADDNARAGYKAAIEYLKLVAKGEIAILAPNEGMQPAGIGAAVFEPGQKVMGREAAEDIDFRELR